MGRKLFFQVATVSKADRHRRLRHPKEASRVVRMGIEWGLPLLPRELVTVPRVMLYDDQARRQARADYAALRDLFAREFRMAPPDEQINQARALLERRQAAVHGDTDRWAMMLIVWAEDQTGLTDGGFTEEMSRFLGMNLPGTQGFSRTEVFLKGFGGVLLFNIQRRLSVEAKLEHIEQERDAEVQHALLALFLFPTLARSLPIILGALTGTLGLRFIIEFAIDAALNLGDFLIQVEQMESDGEITEAEAEELVWAMVGLVPFVKGGLELARAGAMLGVALLPYVLGRLASWYEHAERLNGAAAAGVAAYGESSLMVSESGRDEDELLVDGGVLFLPFPETA